MRHDPLRVVEVQADDPPFGRLGTGYLITDRLVLTAAAVCGSSVQQGRHVAVTLPRSADPRERFACAVHAAGPDLAVLELVDNLWVPVDGGDARFGVFSGSAEWIAGAVAAGSPVEVQFAPRHGPAAAPLHPPITAKEPVADPAALSGAAVFVADLLAGVAVWEKLEGGAGRLAVVPAGAALETVAALTRRAPPVMEPIELAELMRRWDAPGPPRTALDLLDPARELMPFSGRQALLQRLTTWCRRPAYLAGLLVVAEEGGGKTRLARELARSLRSEGWLAVELSRHPPATLSLRRVEHLDQPLLLIADDVDEHPDAAAAVLAHLVRRPTRHAVRVLMLARTADGWWGTWRERIGLAGTALVAEPERLAGEEPISAVDIAGALGPHLDALNPTTDGPARSPGPPAEDRPEAASSTSTPAGGSPSAVQLAVLAHLLTAEDRDATLLGTTLRGWERLAGTLSAGARRRWPDAVAMAMVCEPPDRGRALDLVACLPGSAGEGSAALGDEVVDALRRAFPSADPWLHWQRPLPGQLARQHLAEHPPALWAGLVPMLDAAEARLTLLRLAPAAADSTDLAAVLRDLVVRHVDRLGGACAAAAVRTGTPGPILDALRAATLDGVPASMSEAVLRDMASGPLAGLALELRERAVRELRDRPAEAPHRLVVHLIGWSELLAAEGDLEAAVEAAAEARERAARGSVQHLPEALRAHAACLLLAGRSREAREPADAAVALCRDLAATDPVRSGGLGAALAFAAEVLLAAEEPDRAAAAALQAVDGYRAGGTPWLFDLARALCLRSDALAAVGSVREAADAMGEAVAVYEQLAGERPQANLGRLTAAEEVLRDRLWLCGDLAGAVAAAERAVTAHRRLAEHRPDEPGNELAGALGDWSELLAEAGRPQQALAAAREAVRSVRPEPVDGPALIAALHVLMHRYERAGRAGDAAKIAVKLVGIGRRRLADDPQGGRAELVRALVNLSAMLALADDDASSLLAAEEAIDLASGTGSSAEEQLAYAAALNNRAIVAGDVADAERAVALLSEAGYAKAPQFATAAATWSRLLAEAGDLGRAIDTAREVVRLHEEVLAAAPAVLAAAWHALADRLVVAGHPDAAGAVARARALYRDLDPGREPAALALMAADLPGAGIEERFDAAHEAVALLGALADGDPEEYLDDLVEAQEVLAGLLEAAGQPETSVQVTFQVVANLRGLAASGVPQRRADLAAALRRLAVRMSHVNRVTATRFAEEAADVATQANARPEEAAAAHLLAVLLADGPIADPESALRRAQVAVALYRRLAADDERYREPFTMALLTLSQRHRAVGNDELAHAHAEETVKHFTALARNRRDHRAGLAGALLNLAATILPDDMGALRDIYQRVIEILEQPDVDLPDRLADAHDRLAEVMERSGRKYREQAAGHRRRAQLLRGR